MPMCSMPSSQISPIARNDCSALPDLAQNCG
jgi:hypothetical protein